MISKEASTLEASRRSAYIALTVRCLFLVLNVVGAVAYLPGAEGFKRKTQVYKN